MREITDHSLYAGGGDMPDECVYQIAGMMRRLDYFTSEDGSTNWEGMMLTYDIPDRQTALNLHSVLAQTITSRIRLAHSLGRSREVNNLVQATQKEIFEAKQEYYP